MSHNISCPNMRMELLEAFRALSDIDYQKKVWVRREFCGDIKYDEFDYAVHTIFDDLEMQNDPGVGVVLYSQDEAEVVRVLIESIDLVFSRYGFLLSDSEYIEKDEWRNVVDAAKVAYDALLANDFKYGHH